MKRFLSLGLALLMVLALVAGCAQPAAPAATDTPAAPVQTEPAAPASTPEPEAAPAITVTDQGGNTVTLAAPAQKVVTCFYGQTYALIALGLTDRLAAIEAKAQARPIYALAAPELIELPNVGSQKEFNVEAAIAMEPDLVLLPKKLQDTAATFAAVDIPVAICYPESQELLEEMLVMIATLCGEPARADALLAYYDKKFAEVDALTAAITEADRPKVYMGSPSAYLSTAPKAMYQAGLIEKAGGVNAAAEIDGDYWADVSYEQILAMNPDIIILPCEAQYTVDDILGDKQLSKVTAVKNKAVYAMPNSFEAWDSCVPSGVLGTLWLLATIHGDVYSMDQMRADATDFYSTFYGFEVDASLIQ